MKITTVTYQKTYSIGPYLTDKIGLEASLEDGEIVSDALDNLRAKADEWHKGEHPHLYQQPISSVSQRGANYKPPPSALTTASSGEPMVINLQHEKLSILIENAETIEDLKVIKELNPVMPFPLHQLYNKRLEELTTGRPTDFTEGLDNGI